MRKRLFRQVRGGESWLSRCPATSPALAGAVPAVKAFVHRQHTRHTGRGHAALDVRLRRLQTHLAQLHFVTGKLRAVSVYVCIGPATHITSCLAAYSGQLVQLQDPMPLPRQVLFLGRTLSESSKSDVHAGFCRPPSCSDSGRLVMASPSTEQHTTQMDQQHLHRHLTTPPAAPRRKLPQCTFQMNMSTAYGSTAATPIPGGISDPPITCYQHAHSYYLQSEAVEAQSTTTVKQHATHAASMSALMAAAKPISSAEHLLQKLQRRSTPTTITSEQESSGNHETSALTTCNLLDTGGSRSFFSCVVSFSLSLFHLFLISFLFSTLMSHVLWQCYHTCLR